MGRLRFPGLVAILTLIIGLLLFPELWLARFQPAAGASVFSDGAPSGTERASLTIASEPAGALVILDRDSVGTTPLRQYPLQAGVYLLSLQKAQYQTFDTLLVLDAEQPASFDLTLRPDR